MTEKQLQELGLTEEQTTKVLALKGKAIAAVEAERDAAQAKLDTATEQLAEANKTIAGFKDMDIEGIKKAAEDYKLAAEQAKQDAEERIAAMEYDALLKDSVAGITFSSEAAKREILRQLGEKGLKRDKDKILGLEDAIKALQEADKGAFVSDDQQLPAGIRLMKPDGDGHYLKNPFKRGADFNLTEAGRIAQENPELARKLAKEAGYLLE